MTATGYLKEFGTQAYFVNIPSKFIGSDGVTMWLLYSGNFSLEQNERPHPVNPPGSPTASPCRRSNCCGNDG